MAYNKEIEFKNLLTEYEYSKLLKIFNPNNLNLKTQTNIYFDTDDLILKRNNCALRARIIGETIELTLKSKASIGLVETTDIINETELNMLINNHIIVKKDVYNELNKLNINNPLKEIATLVTYRFETEYLNNILAIDKSIYYNHIDFELELETQDYDYGKKCFDELLKQYNIPIRKTDNKIARAYTYKISMKN